MTIQWLGHACFRITHQDYSIVIDPYNSDYINGYPKLHVRADQVLVSHAHFGHNYRDGRRGGHRLETVEDFANYFESPELVHVYESDTIEIVPGMEPQIAVLKYDENRKEETAETPARGPDRFTWLKQMINKRNHERKNREH